MPVFSFLFSFKLCSENLYLRPVWAISDIKKKTRAITLSMSMCERVACLPMQDEKHCIIGPRNSWNQNSRVYCMKMSRFVVFFSRIYFMLMFYFYFIGGGAGRMRISKWVKIICALLNYFYVALFRTSYLLHFNLEFRLYAAVDETVKKYMFFTERSISAC